MRVLYTGLALLIGLGLVGFGIGGGFGGGGLFTSLNSGEGSGSTSFSGQIKKYRKLTREQPKNLSAWENLTKNLLHEAGGEQYVTSAGAVTSKGSRPVQGSIAGVGQLHRAEPAQAQRRTCAADGDRVQRSGPQRTRQGGRNPPDRGRRQTDQRGALRAARPVRLQSQEPQPRRPRLDKAVSLSPASERVRVKNALAEVKTNPSGEKTYTLTTNGKTYAGKLNAKGEFKATEVKSTPTTTAKSTTTPATKSTTTATTPATTTKEK